MKAAAFIVAAMTIVTSAAGAADVGISVSIGQPGFYGRIDLGPAPTPQLVYQQPIVIEPAPMVVAPAPLYLHVAPGHAKHWRDHCREYNACGVPVYFVRNKWYNQVYVPHYQQHPDQYEHHAGRHDDDDHGRWRGHDQH